ncbi:MAG TPA: hypothetical protein VG826_27425 [Pirellulales bacterium]|nr:hypothetical protein [Pirellulales bacterium]
MNAQSECSALWRPRIATAIVALAVAGGITLANLSSERVTQKLISESANRPERAYGWPVTWYWRVASTVAGRIPPWNGLPVRPLLEWPIARYSATGLLVDLAVWLLLLAISAVACRWALRKLQLQLRWAPRVTTSTIALLTAVPMVLANMTCELSYRTSMYGVTGLASFGWPLVWHWYIVVPFDNVYGWDFSAARLACNIVVWLGTLAAVALVWDWLLCRYRPRLRFSLWTLLTVVAIVSVLCAWCAAVRKRADEQDALAASSVAVNHLWVERPGPKWLRLVLPDCYRRRLVGASISVGCAMGPDDEAQLAPNLERGRIQNGKEPVGLPDEEASEVDDTMTLEDERLKEEELLQRLGRLPDLRFLSIGYCRLTPTMDDALAKLQQLRVLHIASPFLGWAGRTTNLAWVGHLPQLEQLSLTRVPSDELDCLSKLTRLKSLRLDLTDCEHDEAEMDKRLAAVGKVKSITRLYLRGSPGAQISHLAGLTNLKSLALEFYHCDSDEERIRRCCEAIGALTQIEELLLAAPDGVLRIRPHNLASLRGMTNLRSLCLRVSCDKCDNSERQVCLAAIAKLTQLRRLCLQGDLVTTGLAELTPLESLEELLISDRGMETPMAIESLAALKSLKAVWIPALSTDVPSLADDTANARRALESFQRSHHGRVRNLWLEAQSEATPWLAWQEFDEKGPDLDSFLGGNPGIP